MRAAVGIVLIAFSLLMGFPAAAASSCQKGCKKDLVACRRMECAHLDGVARRRCVDACGTRSTCTAPGGAIRTLTYVVSECRTDADGAGSFSQTLMIRRGNCDPIAIKTFRSEPIPQDTVCGLFGSLRVGNNSLLAGVLQRLGVLPDGSGVIFEVTDEFSQFPTITSAVSDVERGIFFVRADGSGLRRLGDATHAPTFRLGEFSNSTNEIEFAISPDQSTIAFSDVGLGADGLPALQIFTMDVSSGRRRQLTQLTARNSPAPLPEAGGPAFIDDRTIVFYVLADPSDPFTGQVSMSVRTDGSGLHSLAPPVEIPGGMLVPRFDVTRGGTHAAHVSFEGKPLDPYVTINPDHFREIFVFDGKNALQLTNYQQFDTHLPQVSRGRVLFVSSADPLPPQNEGRICQLFSIGALGNGLRQLTHFEDSRPLAGCTFVPGGACTLTSTPRPDPVTGTIVLSANCDPLGANPFGDQLFAVRPDGAGLRQLTSLAGMRQLADGTLSVELAGPFSYSAPLP
jgi:hypothetical protein